MKLVENGTLVTIPSINSQSAIVLASTPGGTPIGIFAILASSTDRVIQWALGLRANSSLVGGQLMRVGSYLYWQCSNGVMILITASPPQSPVYVANNPTTTAFMSLWFDYAFQKLVPGGYAPLIPGVKMIQSTVDAG